MWGQGIEENQVRASRRETKHRAYWSTACVASLQRLGCLLEECDVLLQAVRASEGFGGGERHTPGHTTERAALQVSRCCGHPWISAGHSSQSIPVISLVLMRGQISVQCLGHAGRTSSPDQGWL